VTTIVLLAAGAVAATSLGLALMLCVAAARADRQMKTQQGAVPYKEHAAS
jgi:hypothetical protein